MKAAFYTGQKTFEIRDIPRQPPQAGEVEVKVAFNGICGTDMHAYHGAMDARIGHNRVLGHEMSGTIAAVGNGVDMPVGAAVAIRPLDACGDCPACATGLSHICHRLKFLGLDTDGALQEYWTVPAHTIHRLPEGASLEHAALTEPVAVACHDIRRGRVAAGEDVLVIGGGPIGILIAMVARDAGARVILSEVNPHRLEVAQALGFAAMNPREVDPVDHMTDRTQGKGADVVFEVSGTQAGTDLMTAAAASRGRIVMVAIHTTRPQIDMFRFFWRELELIGARVYEPEDFDAAIDLLARGVIDTRTMITDIRPLKDVSSAFAALDGDARSMKTLVQVG